jgi:hypothetical protein
VASWHLQDFSPRLCQLRIVRLALVSKYRTYRLHVGDMGPVNLVVGCQQKFDFSPTAPLDVLGEKLGTDPRIRQPVCCGLCREPFFSGVVDLFKSIDDCMKGCHVRGPPAGSIRWAYMDWRGKRTCRVGRVFPCRVYIDSNHRDSRI